MRFQSAAASRCLAVAQHFRWFQTQPFGQFHSCYQYSTMTASSALNANGTESQGTTLADLPKSWHFTSSLPHDPKYPTPADSHKTPRDEIGPRQVRGAIFTWVRPEMQKDPELLAVSPAAMRDIGLAMSEAETEEFRQTVVGNKLHGWDSETLTGPGYPWAQCYGGFQFGDWAGQLGDGRAISLFESTNPQTGVRYEIQLKGAGMTPYSRFADGKAVLRSSIREFIVSEALNALGIPSTRALALSLLPHSRVRRETIEPGAIVVRFAQSWIRLGNFDILRARGDRALTRKLATYVAEDVYGGWDKLPARLDDPDSPAETSETKRGVPKDEIQGPEGSEENRFTRLYREIVRRNALTVAKWQAYGFMNGVLNTDNTSILGLSIDFGPFAFMDNFDPQYTPNHDDHFLRYSYRNQPTIIWWNLVRLGEALGELMGAGPLVDDPSFLENGLKDESAAEPIIARAEKIITQVGEEYKHVFLTEYKRLVQARLGLLTHKESDFDQLFSNLFDLMADLSLDFNHFFRRLSTIPISSIDTEESRLEKSRIFFPKDYATTTSSTVPQSDGQKKLAEWLAAWRTRIIQDWGSLEDWASSSSVTPEKDQERMAAMKSVNPNFIPRGWILDEIIKRVEKGGERDVLRRAMHMALHPFEDTWTGNNNGTETETGYQGDAEEEQRWVGDVPTMGRAMQCSCSS
ncbi:Uncharacterized ACR, YdiU/UPF0061 family domain containing protein [Naviculisporaceae sp. PSN 640]